MSRLNVLWGDIYGSIGDFGTLIPLTLGMANRGVIDIGPSFFWGGIFNIMTGWHFGIPIPIQPMKVIATDESLTRNEVITSGVLTGLLTALLGITNTTEVVKKFTPPVLIAVIQFSLGLKMVISGLTMSLNSNETWLTIISAVTLLTGTFFETLPTALVLLVTGIIKVLIVHKTSLKLMIPMTSVPVFTTGDFINGFLKGTLTQLPITILNSVISFSELSEQLFGPIEMVTIPQVSLSICIINTFSPFMGAMPSCHGAGGLASQYRYGARTGRSMVVLGIVKIITAILFGNSLKEIMEKFPSAVLGTLLVGSGIELATHGIKKLPTGDEKVHIHNMIFTISVGTVMVTNTFYGYLLGLFIYFINFIPTLKQRCSKRREYSLVEIEPITTTEMI